MFDYIHDAQNPLENATPKITKFGLLVKRPTPSPLQLLGHQTASTDTLLSPEIQRQASRQAKRLVRDLVIKELKRASNGILKIQ